MKTVTIVLDDVMRPTAVAEILEVLVSRLVDNGVSRANITIVVALGTHGAMKRAELEARLGSGVASKRRHTASMSSSQTRASHCLNSEKRVGFLSFLVGF